MGQRFIHLVNPAVCDFFFFPPRTELYSEVMSSKSRISWWEFAGWDCGFPKVYRAFVIESKQHMH